MKQNILIVSHLVYITRLDELIAFIASNFDLLYAMLFVIADIESDAVTVTSMIKS